MWAEMIRGMLPYQIRELEAQHEERQSEYELRTRMERRVCDFNPMETELLSKMRQLGEQEYDWQRDGESA